MRNLIKEIKESINKVIISSLDKCIAEKKLPEAVMVNEAFIEVPKERANGDFSTNIAMQMAKTAKMSPRLIAEAIISNMDINGTCIKEIQIAGAGFINFYLKDEWIYEVLEIIDKEGDLYGKSEQFKGQKVNVEFVSANPTGPLHMGNARGGALGDCIASVLEAVGYEVTREFYVNDAGNQIELLAQSLEARYVQLLKGEDAWAFPENGYKGEDIAQHMKDFVSENGEKYLDINSDQRKQVFAQYALERNIAGVKTTLADYGVEFDVWFSEKTLHESNQVRETVELLTKNGHTYEKDGAIWFKTTNFGLDKDDVLIRANGIPTYYAADIAYHRNKLVTRGFDRAIDLWGTDHHGHVARVKVGIEACGINADGFQVVLFQLVRLLRNGEVARMSKRKGTAISVGDLIEEVGRDAARFFFNSIQAETHLDFDLEVAASKSNDNPVYYVQYAHARVCNIIRVLKEEGYSVPALSEINPLVLDSKEETEIIRKLIEFPERMLLAAEELEPSKLTRYLVELAGLFHSFYDKCKIKGQGEAILKARLLLVDRIGRVIGNTLRMLKISAPENM